MTFRFSTERKLRRFFNELVTLDPKEKFFQGFCDDAESVIDAIREQFSYPIYMKYLTDKRDFEVRQKADEAALKYIPKKTIQYCKKEFNGHKRFEIIFKKSE